MAKIITVKQIDNTTTYVNADLITLFWQTDQQTLIQFAPDSTLTVQNSARDILAQICEFQL